MATVQHRDGRTVFELMDDDNDVEQLSEIRSVMATYVDVCSSGRSQSELIDGNVAGEQQKHKLSVRPQSQQQGRREKRLELQQELHSLASNVINNIKERAAEPRNSVEGDHEHARRKRRIQDQFAKTNTRLLRQAAPRSSQSLAAAPDETSNLEH